MFSSHLWPSELIGVHAEQVVHVAGGPLREQLLHLGKKLMGMMIKMDRMIKIVMTINMRIIMIQLLHLGRTLLVMMTILDARTLLITTEMTLFQDYHDDDDDENLPECWLKVQHCPQQDPGQPEQSMSPR